MFEDFNRQIVDGLTVSMTQRSGYCECGCRRVSLGFCYDGKKCVCVRVGVCLREGKAGRMDMPVRMRPLTVMCPHCSDTNM